MSTKDKVKQKEYALKYYKKNKAAIIEKSAKDKIKCKKILKDYIVEYLKNHPCIDCGESDIIVLEFDHVRGIKRANVTDLMRLNCSLINLQLEIDKCDVRCANCHRRITYKRRIELRK